MRKLCLLLLSAFALLFPKEQKEGSMTINNVICNQNWSPFLNFSLDPKGTGVQLLCGQLEAAAAAAAAATPTTTTNNNNHQQSPTTTTTNNNNNPANDRRAVLPLPDCAGKEQ